MPSLLSNWAKFQVLPSRCHSTQNWFLIELCHFWFIHRAVHECYEEDPCAAHEQQLTLQAKTKNPYPTVPCFSLLVPAGVGVPPVTLAEEAGQEVLPGGGPRLHPPAFSVFLLPNLTHLICHYHRQRTESHERAAPILGHCRAALTGLLAAWGAEHVEWLWLSWSSRIRSRWVWFLSSASAYAPVRRGVVYWTDRAPGICTAPRSLLALGLCFFCGTLKGEMHLIYERADVWKEIYCQKPLHTKWFRNVWDKCLQSWKKSWKH